MPNLRPLPSTYTATQSPPRSSTAQHHTTPHLLAILSLSLLLHHPPAAPRTSSKHPSHKRPDPQSACSRRQEAGPGASLLATAPPPVCTGRRSTPGWSRGTCAACSFGRAESCEKSNTFFCRRFRAMDVGREEGGNIKVWLAVFALRRLRGSLWFLESESIGANDIAARQRNTYGESILYYIGYPTVNHCYLIK